MVDEGPASENLHSLRKSRDEYMFSGIRHIAAEREPCRHLRSAPRAAVTQRAKTDDRLRPYNPMNGLYIRALVVALLGSAANILT